MSDMMLFAVLRMPMELLRDDLSLLQFIDRARQAADRIEADADRIAELERQVAELREDAGHWRALIRSARIRPLGSAGLTSEVDQYGHSYNEYAHLGLELWTVFGSSLSDEGHEKLAKENALGLEWLIKYAEIAALAQAKTEGA